MTENFPKSDSIETGPEEQDEQKELPAKEEKEPSETTREKLMKQLEELHEEVQRIVNKGNKLSKEQQQRFGQDYPELSLSINRREFVEILEEAAGESSWVEFRKLFGRWGKFEDLFKKIVEDLEQQQEKAEK